MYLKIAVKRKKNWDILLNIRRIQEVKNFIILKTQQEESVKISSCQSQI